MNQSAKLDDMVQIVKTNAIAARMVALASPNQVIKIIFCQGEGHCVLKWGFTWTFPGYQDATLK